MPDPRRTSPNIVYVGDVDRPGMRLTWRCTRVPTGSKTTWGWVLV